MSVIVLYVAFIVAVGCWLGSRTLGDKAEDALEDIVRLGQDHQPVVYEMRTQTMKYAFWSGICSGGALIAGVTAVGAVIYLLLL